MSKDMKKKSIIILSAVLVIAIATVVFLFTSTGSAPDEYLADDASVFIVFHTNGLVDAPPAAGSAERIYMATDSLDAISGTLTGGEADGFSIRVYSGDTQVWQDFSTAYEDWRFEAPVLLPGDNTVTVRAYLEDGGIVDGSIVIRADAPINIALDVQDMGDGTFAAATEVIETAAFRPVTASVHIDGLLGEQVSTLSVRPVTQANGHLLSSNIPGYLGMAQYITVQGDFDSAQITFYFDEGLGAESEDFMPRIFRIDPETGVPILLAGQIVGNGRVTATVNSFSPFVLLNNALFQRSIERASGGADSASNLGAANVSDRAPMDIVIVINDILAAHDANVYIGRQIVNMLSDVDQVALCRHRAASTGLHSTSLDLTNNFNDIRQSLDIALDGRFPFFQPMNLWESVANGVDLAKDYRKARMARHPTQPSMRVLDPDVQRVVVLISDGTGSTGFTAPWGQQFSVNEEIERANYWGVTIHTISYGPTFAPAEWGIGNTRVINTERLIGIARDTGGRHVHINSLDEVQGALRYLFYDSPAAGSAATAQQAGNAADSGSPPIDRTTSCNNNGLSCHHAHLIYTGAIGMQNGSRELMGTNFCEYPDLVLLSKMEIRTCGIYRNEYVYFYEHPFIHHHSNWSGHPMLGYSINDLRLDFTDHNRFGYSSWATENGGPLDRAGRAYTRIVSRINLLDLYKRQLAEFFNDSAMAYYENANMWLGIELDKYITRHTIAELVTMMEDGQMPLREGGEHIRRLYADLDREIHLRLTSNASPLMLERLANAWGVFSPQTGERLVAKICEFLGVKLAEDFAVKAAGQTNQTLGTLAGRAFTAVNRSLALGTNARDLANNTRDLIDFRNALVSNAATIQMLYVNFDLIREIEQKASHRDMRRAATFVRETKEGEVQVLATRMAEMAAGAHISTAIDLAKTINGYFAIMGLMWDSFNIAIEGQRGPIEVEHQMLFYHEMTEITLTLWNDYILFFQNPRRPPSDAYVRHLTNLLNLRIRGEAHFYSLTESRVARDNIFAAQNFLINAGLPLFQD